MSQASINETVVRRFVEEIWNQGHVEIAEEIAAPDLVDHHLPPEMPRGPQVLTQWYQLVHAAIPDVHLEIQNVVADASQVAVHAVVTGTHQGEFMGLEPTGNAIATQTIAIFRLEDGKIKDIWEVGDSLTLMRQLGAVPAG